MASLSNLLLVTLFAIQTTQVTGQSSGCGTASSSFISSGKSANISIESGNLERSYLLHIPESYNSETPVPLILSFHGRTRSAESQEALSQFSNATLNPNSIAVYPQGVMDSNGDRQWQGDPDAPASIDDIMFALDIIDQVSSQYCIDPEKIFATGKSNGGELVNLLACDPKASSIIAAFAPVSGAYYLQSNGTPPPCNPSRTPIPMLEFHGWLDDTAPYEGGINTRGNGMLPAIPDWIRDWVTRDGCTPAQNTSSTLCSSEKSVTRYTWTCDGMEDAVVHYNISNLKHDWPSTHPNSDSDRTTCFDATSFIMDFFGNHSLPSSALEAEFPMGHTQATVGRFEVDGMLMGM